MNDSLKTDYCVAAAALSLNTIDSSPGATKAELMGLLTQIIFEALTTYERETRFRQACLPSVN